MASPNGNLDEVHEGLLLQAVRASWLAKENRARIDDVVDFLKNASDSEQYAESPTIRSRLDEMIVLLDQYTAGWPCDDGADRWSGVVCRKIITPFLARGFFPDVLCLSSGCAGRSGAVTGVVSLTVTG